MYGLKSNGQHRFGMKDSGFQKLGHKIKNSQVIEHEADGGFFINVHGKDNQHPHHKQGDLEKIKKSH